MAFFAAILILCLFKEDWELHTANAAKNLTGCSGDDVMGDKVMKTSKNEE